MSVERIEAAIAKLEELRAEMGNLGTWVSYKPRFSHGFVTLHRTIDAQLAILRLALPAFAAEPKLAEWVHVHTLALADAILGDGTA